MIFTRGAINLRNNLLIDVEGYLDKEELRVVRGTLRDLQGVEGTRRISGLLEGVSSGLGLFVGYSDKSQGVKEGDIVRDGIGRCGKDSGKCTCDSKCSDGNQKYTSSYKREGSTPGGTGTTDDNMSWDEIYDECISSGTSGTDSAPSGTSGTLATLARILLGAIPLVFSGLSYMAWMAGSNKWSKDNTTTAENFLLCQFMMRMGYTPSQLRKVTGDQLYPQVIKECGVLGKEEVKGNYATYLDELRKKALPEAGKKDTKEHSLLKLNILCSGYFRSLHTLDTIRDPRPRTPNTIREILYWLTSLPYCPIYRTLVPKVQEMIRRIGSKSGGSGQGESVVMFYGTTGNGSPLTVSDENCASYLLGGALVAPMVLLCIQDTVECLVGRVTDVSRPEGWPYCKYGVGVKCDDEGKDGTGCKSWICPEAVENGQAYWDAVKKGNEEEKKKAWQTLIKAEQCGKNGGSSGASNPSPLQAFLTDCLKGFTCPVVMDDSSTTGTSGSTGSSGKEYQENLQKLRDKKDKSTLEDYNEAYPGFLDHRTHTMSVFGQECAVPMGFSGSFRKDSSQCVGLGIYGALSYYSNDDVYSASLYQITRCISSLTRRVPRSTGTLYGFFYGLGGMCNGGGGGKFKPKLEEELRCCPGWRDPECLMDAVKEWTESDHSTKHKKERKKNNYTSGSLHACNNETKDGNPSCGDYLRPITGYLYNSVATVYCDTYISWIVHLTGVLHSGLKSLLDEFRNINCKEAGCKDKDGKDDCKCPSNGCKEGTHGVVNSGTGNKEGCCCPSVADCVGVHGLFYRFGFSYTDPRAVSGKGYGGGDKYKRQCKQFYERLKKVIEGGPFINVFKEIYRFLYSTRALFGVYIGVYWSAVLGYLVYSMTVNLDLVHIQSHWKPAQSHLVPLQRILADGSRNVKRVCTLGYFQDSGDSLLSQGVSDVYL
ncbi:variant erythrocyte surface antigen alpha subunit, putative [Babesia ovis]|uniref:Variant erythrocyte surface antigen alpha subunit, putative n=1 Tax=Babesia ovis TaxID=5869 RepID=A0A9W5TBM1_BABOV|nr:variant erythrocyte surface antigen alpha subunit, putative [Babesia ovis]